MTLCYHQSSPRFLESDTPDQVSDKLLQCVRKDHKFFQHLQVAFDRWYRFNLLDTVKFRSASDFAREILSWNIERIDWFWRSGAVHFIFRHFESKPYFNLDEKN